MPKRACASASTSLTWRLVSRGRSLDDKGAVRVVAVDGVGLRDAGAEQPRHQLRGDRANLGKLQGGVAERAIVDGDLDAFACLRFLRQRSGPADHGYHPPELFVDVHAFTCP